VQQQRCLWIPDEERFAALWDHFREDQRQEVIALYARLLARASVIRRVEKRGSLQGPVEVSHE
jgi:hypothetical protein